MLYYYRYSSVQLQYDKIHNLNSCLNRSLKTSTALTLNYILFVSQSLIIDLYTIFFN